MGIPDSCPNEQPFDPLNCGASFKDKRNLRQDTDNCVYCTRCGQVIGVFQPGTVPFSWRDDNAWP